MNENGQPPVVVPVIARCVFCDKPIAESDYCMLVNISHRLASDPWKNPSGSLIESRTLAFCRNCADGGIPWAMSQAKKDGGNIELDLEAHDSGQEHVTAESKDHALNEAIRRGDQREIDRVLDEVVGSGEHDAITDWRRTSFASAAPGKRGDEQEEDEGAGSRPGHRGNEDEAAFDRLTFRKEYQPHQSALTDRETTPTKSELERAQVSRYLQSPAASSIAPRARRVAKMWVEYRTQEEIAIETGMSQPTVSRIIKDVRGRANGY